MNKNYIVTINAYLKKKIKFIQQELQTNFKKIIQIKFFK